jgi:hypothetical protein
MEGRSAASGTENACIIFEWVKAEAGAEKDLYWCISKGFDFLGYRSNGFGALGLAGLAQQTINNHKQRLLLLYERSASDQRVENYVSNWQRWTVSGLARV